MSAEKQEVEVFGTREVSVKEFMGASDKSLVLLSDLPKAKENLIALRQKHEARVEELIAIDKLSSDEQKELNGIRAELREPRYLVQNIEKNNISVFEAYKKNDKANLRELIDINSDLEDKATAKLQAEEQCKKDEKEAEAKAEENRVARIESAIDDIETYCLQVIQSMNFDNLKVSSETVEQSLNAENDFEEYNLLLDQVKDRVMKSLMEKTNDITARENQRLENEKMKQEIFQTRVLRLKELGFCIDAEDKAFYSNESSLAYEQSLILNLESYQFEEVLLEIKTSKEQAKQAKRDVELKKQKDEQFEIRKSRLAEIGFNFVDDGFYYGLNTSIESQLIYDADATNFEQRLKNAKLLVADSIKRQEDELKAQEDELKAQEEAKKKELADKKKADAENKARVKRLAKDKAVYEMILKESLLRFPAVFQAENEEIKQFSIEASEKVAVLVNDLLTQLNEL